MLQAISEARGLNEAFRKCWVDDAIGTQQLEAFGIGIRDFRFDTGDDVCRNVERVLYRLTQVIGEDVARRSSSFSSVSAAGGSLERSRAA